MADNIYELKQGAHQTIFTRLRDKNGPVDLSTFLSVSLVLKTPGPYGSAALIGVCDVNPDQINLKGYVRYKFTSPIPTGLYDVEFHGRNADDDPIVFPTTWQPAYEQLRCVRSLTNP